MKYDILCVGDATLDIIMAGIPEDIFSRDSTLASTSKWLVGGDAANQACTFDALGMKTALTAKIGTDLVGNTIYQMLSESTIDLSYMIRTPDQVSGYCVAVVQPNGQRCFLLSMGDGDRDLKPEEIDFSVLDETRAVSVGSLFCLYEMDIRGTRMLFEAARKKGVLTFADMTGDSFKIGPQALNDIYPFTDYLLPSLEEGIYVTGKSDPGEIAQWFLDHGVSNVLVKLGEKAAFSKMLQRHSILLPFPWMPLIPLAAGIISALPLSHPCSRGKQRLKQSVSAMLQEPLMQQVSELTAM